MANDPKSKKVQKPEPTTISNTPHSIRPEEYENFRMYHQLQYDRIDKFESRRENFSNIVISLSAGIYLIGVSDIAKLNFITGGVLPGIVIFANAAGILFAWRSRSWVKMHKQRAKIARMRYAPELNEINEQAGRPHSEDDLLRRENIYKFLHILICLISVAAICLYCRFPILSNNPTETKIIEQNNIINMTAKDTVLNGK